MLHNDLASAIHQDRIREAQENSRRFAHSRERSAERHLQRAQARARKRRMKVLRREAHRATVGAFVAFGDGVANPSADPGRQAQSRTEVRAGGRR